MPQGVVRPLSALVCDDCRFFLRTLCGTNVHVMWNSAQAALPHELTQILTSQSVISESQRYVKHISWEAVKTANLIKGLYIVCTMNFMIY